MAKRRKKHHWKPKSTKEALSLLVSLFVVCLCIVSFTLSYQKQYGTLPSWGDLMDHFGLSYEVSVDLPQEVLQNGTSVHFINVGQADATLILSAGESCLVDAGDFESADSLISYLDSIGIETLDYLVMTHPHADHIGSMDDVLENYTVGQVILPDFSLAPAPTSKIFQTVIETINAKQIPAVTAQQGQSYSLGNGTLEILADGVKTDNYNNLSPVIRFSGEFSVLLSGDGEKEVEQDVLGSGVNLKADVFQAGHHGSSTSNTREFLQAVRPQITVVSCGKDNSYGHPHKEAIENFQLVGSDIYRTDKQGNVVVYYQDGIKVWLENAA